MTETVRSAQCDVREDAAEGAGSVDAGFVGAGLPALEAAPPPTRGPVERTRVVVWTTAEVQDNGDGTWSACLSDRRGTVVTAGSREAVLSLLSEKYSAPEPPA